MRGGRSNLRRSSGDAKSAETRGRYGIGNPPSESALTLASPRFADGLAPFPSNLGVGFLDRTGRVRIQPQFCYTSGFSEGLAAVQVKNQYVFCDRTDNLWGYIDRTGRFVIEARFREAQMFAGGLAVVRTIDRTYHLIDQTGRAILDRSTLLPSSISWDTPR